MNSMEELRAAVVADRSGMWNALGVLECAERILAEKDARIAELEAELSKATQRCSIMTATASRFEDRADRFSAQLTASRAECEGLRAAKLGDTIEIKNTFFDCAGQNTPLTYRTDGSAHLKMDGWFCFAEDPRAAPSPSPAPGVVTDEMVDAAYEVFAGKMLMREEDRDLIKRVLDAALASLSQPAKGEREGGGDA